MSLILKYSVVNRLPKSTNTACALALIAIAITLPLVWFGTKCLNYVDYDGMTYIGIARHITAGEFYDAINAFRSPLLSWLIASVAFINHNLLIVGKLVTVLTFLLCLCLLYLLTYNLWKSATVAGLAVIWFSLARGVPVLAVEFVTPDFLLAALTLIYFLVLIRCLRNDKDSDWFFLGCAHGIAFLAKAFALPWLAVATCVSAFLDPHKNWRRSVYRITLAALVPILFSAAWGAVLRSKYGIFTTGSQFKTNLLQWTLREKDKANPKGYVVLRDEWNKYDGYMVNDPMPPNSFGWHYKILLRKLVPAAIATEIHNLPIALKELTIVATPGGLVFFVFGLIVLVRNRTRNGVEFWISAIILLSTCTLIVAYCMLCFDGRYILPVIPLLIAIASHFLLGTSGERPLGLHSIQRRLGLALVLLGLAFSFVYRSSPFRTLTREFDLSCYDAAVKLRTHSGVELVSIGEGPYPEHGVGWEAGYKSAFLAGYHLVGASDKLPLPNQVTPLVKDVKKSKADTVMVWGRPSDLAYVRLIAALQLSPEFGIDKISDNSIGEVGTIFFKR